MPETGNVVCVEDFFATIESYLNKEQVEFVRKAYDVAAEAHASQRRKSGEPYIIHPLGVATILSQLQLDELTLAAAFLHDVVEDTEISLDSLKESFGQKVADLVDGVTKLGKIEYISKEEQQIENYRKMFLAMAKDIRVVMIKLADRLHNMRTMKFMPVHKQQSISRETMEIYAPLAHRLGIYTIKWELEDLAFRYMEPEIYYDLVEQVKVKRREREAMVHSAMGEIKEHLDSMNITCEIQGRPKNFYSIHKKMLRDHKELSEIYDLLAIRVLVDSVKDCYGTLGVVHSMWRPIPGRFKDYVAVPKSNMYQSLHTTVLYGNGQPLEIQIRTFEMHRISEYGIAAHWRYKESGGSKPAPSAGGDKTFDAKLSWLRQLLEWHQDMSDSRDFVNTVKMDVFADEVFVFTPRGDVIDLPVGAVPIDFAYRIHTDVGNRCVGAKVNGRIVPLDYKLSNGDIVEVITSKQAAGPSRDWLNIVKSTQAKNKINQWFKKEFKEDNIIRGKELIVSYCRGKSINLQNILKPKYQQVVQKKYGFRDWDAVLAAIGHGGLKEGQVVNRLFEEYEKEHKKEITDETILERISEANSQKVHIAKSKSGIVVKGINDMAVRFSKCCNPVPGDEIVGFVTRGRGMSIHRTDCINMLHLSDVERARLIDAEWEDTSETEGGGKYLAELKMYANDRQGFLMDISKVFTEAKIDVKSMNVRTSKKGTATIDMGFIVNGREELHAIIEKLRQLQGVLDIERTTG